MAGNKGGGSENPVPGVIHAQTPGLIVAATTNYAVHTTTAGRRARIRKIFGYNGQAADVTILIGTGTVAAAAITQTIPTIRAIALTNFAYGLNELPHFEHDVSLNIVAQASAGGAGTAAVRVQVEVEETGV